MSLGTFLTPIKLYFATIVHHPESPLLFVFSNTSDSFLARLRIVINDTGSIFPISSEKRLYTNGRIEDFQIGGAFPSRPGVVSDVIIASDSMVKATRAAGKLIQGQLKSVQTVGFQMVPGI